MEEFKAQFIADVCTKFEKLNLLFKDLKFYSKAITIAAKICNQSTKTN